MFSVHAVYGCTASATYHLECIEWTVFLLIDLGYQKHLASTTVSRVRQKTPDTSNPPVLYFICVGSVFFLCLFDGF